MIKVFVSDSHLGSYFCLTDLFLSFLEEINKHEDYELNLVGDTFDAWKSSPSDTIVDTLKRYHPNLFIGNHDSELLIGTIVSKSIMKSNVLVVGVKKILITHGHDFDEKFGSNNYLTRLADASVYLASYYLNYDIRSKINFITEFYYNRVSDYMEIVSKKLINAKFDMLVYGHTHIPEDTTRNGVKFINLGNWYTEPYALFIDDDRYAYFKVTNEKMWPNDDDFKKMFI